MTPIPGPSPCRGEGSFEAPIPGPSPKQGEGRGSFVTQPRPDRRGFCHSISALCHKLHGCQWKLKRGILNMRSISAGRNCLTEGSLQMSMVDVPLGVQVSVDEIKRDLPAYLRRVEAGQIVVIVRSGRPVAEIKPIASVPTTLRPFGLCAGQFTVPDDFDAPLPEDIVAEFEGR